MSGHSLSNGKEGEAIQNPCKICLASLAKYACPRCNLAYCSVPCYQSEAHASCSEAFYKDWVMEELKDSSASPEDRQKVLEMLAKDQEQREEDEEDEMDDKVTSLNERLEGLDLDKDVSAVWSRLTPQEKEEFARMLQDGRLARLIEVWTPWWKLKCNQQRVLDPAHQATLSPADRLPEACAGVPDVHKMLMKIKPSDNCRFDVVNILTAYSFVARLHNGCHLECPVDSSQDLLDTCGVLRGLSCSSVGQGLQAVIDAVTMKSKDSDKFSSQFTLTLVRDVHLLVAGPGGHRGQTLTLNPGGLAQTSQDHSTTFMAAALSDLVRVMQAALAVLKIELKACKHQKDLDEQALKSHKSQVFRAEKKLQFLLSWMHHYGSAMHGLIPLIEFEIDTRQTEINDVDEIKSAVEEHMDKLKPLSLEDPDLETLDPITTDINDKETPFTLSTNDSEISSDALPNPLMEMRGNPKIVELN